MLPISAETALQALKLPVSHPWPYMTVLTNYGINMPGEGRQLSQWIGNVIKQGMFFSWKGRSIHLSGQCCGNKPFGGVGRGGEGQKTGQNRRTNCVKLVRRCLGLSHKCANGEVA